MSDLPAGWAEVALGALMPKRRGSIDPRKFPGEEFSLLSIPAFDAGGPERVLGSAVGSTKQLVEPGDVLLSKIVPHIRRAWIVPPESRRSIGSSEWIIFRDSRADPGYLRHLLVSDRFHRSFMQTVAGVGGSLLRARPAHVANILVPLPPLEEQRRIAAILDKADELRAKRRAALEQLDSLTQAIFLDMFGDAFVQRSGTKVADVVSIQIGPFGSLLHQADYVDGGRPLVNPKHIVDSTIVPDFSESVDEAAAERLARYRLQSDDVVLGRRGEMGRCAVVGLEHAGNLCGSGSMILRPDSERIRSRFLADILSSDWGKVELERRAKGVTMLNLSADGVGSLEIPCPDIDTQVSYERVVMRVDVNGAHADQSLAELDALFASLQARAFRGELYAGG